MENTSLAIHYFKLKEKALLQRNYIDYTRAEHEEKLKENTSSAGKAQLETYQQETEAAEKDFQNTIMEMQPVFDAFYTFLDGLRVNKDNPYIIRSTDYNIEFYIDDNKNIHYKKLD